MYCSVYSSRDVSRSAVLVAISVVQASSMSVVQFTYMLDDVGKHYRVLSEMLVVGGGKNSSITGLDRLRGFQEVKAPRFRDNGTGWW